MIAVDTDMLQFHGPLRHAALAECADQIQRWGLTMPLSEPLVLDFGLREFRATGLIEHWICNELEFGYCGKYMFIFADQACPMHRHAQKHETFCVVAGEVRVTLGQREVHLRRGEVLAIAPMVFHSFSGVSNSLLLELSTPCLPSDNEFADPRIACWLREALAHQPPV